MDGKLFSLLAALIHVLMDEHPELVQKILEKSEYYRDYVFVDGADVLKAMEEAFDIITTLIYQHPFT